MRLSLDLTNDIDEKLFQLASKKKISKSEVMKRAFSLYATIEEQLEVGTCLAIISKDNTVVSKLVGIL